MIFENDARLDALSSGLPAEQLNQLMLNKYSVADETLRVEIEDILTPIPNNTPGKAATREFSIGCLMPVLPFRHPLFTPPVDKDPLSRRKVNGGFGH